jgi:DNA polymerase III epsilon subunit-like protein
VAYLFFDVETTGLPRDWKAPPGTGDNWPRIVELAWLLSSGPDDPGQCSSRIVRLPKGATISPEAGAAHGISCWQTQAEGSLLSTVLTDLLFAVQNSEAIVAHNVAFDSPVIESEILRTRAVVPANVLQANSCLEAGLLVWRTWPRICTMQAGTPICLIPGGERGYKWPKLPELYEHLFGCAPEGRLHRAMADVRVTAECFWEMRARGAV